VVALDSTCPGFENNSYHNTREVVHMFSKKGIFLTALVAAILVAGTALAFAGQSSRSPMGNLNLTQEQLHALRGVIQEYNATQFEILTGIEQKFLELEHELKREGRFETKGKERRSVKKANKLVKDIGSSYGQLLKTTVEYVLKAKDVLTEEQKEKLIAGLLDFELEVPDDLTHDYMAFILPESGLDLSNEQIKKILRYRTDMQVRELKLDLNIDYKILDLETELAKEVVDSGKVNNIIMDIADLWARLIDNTVDHFLKAKDVLTVEQKEKLLHLLLMAT
jgi:Spy/CpxP family protein refolding chaperone